jgi:hypothetical protein
VSAVDVLHRLSAAGRLQSSSTYPWRCAMPWTVCRCCVLLLCLQLMEGQLDEWMDAFHTLLTFSHPGLAAADAAGAQWLARMARGQRCLESRLTSKHLVAVAMQPGRDCVQHVMCCVTAHLTQLVWGAAASNVSMLSLSCQAGFHNLECVHSVCPSPLATSLPGLRTSPLHVAAHLTAACGCRLQATLSARVCWMA